MICRDVRQIRDVFQRRYLIAEQPLMRWVVVRLTVVDTGRIDADHLNVPPRDKPVGRRWVQTRKVQLGDACFALLVRAKIFFFIGPVAAESGANQDDAIFERGPILRLPMFELFDRDLVVTIGGTLARYIDARAGAD